MWFVEARLILRFAAAAFLLVAAPALAQQAAGAARLRAMNIPFEAERLVQFAGQGDAAVVDAFLDAGMSPDAVDLRHGATALINAAANGHMRIVTRVLAAGASLDHADRAGNTALVSAAYFGKQAVVELLLARGANPNGSSNPAAMTPLCAAVAGGNTRIASALVAAGADAVDAQREMPPLVAAAYAGRAEMARLLLASKPPAAVVRRALEAARAAKHPDLQPLLEAALP